MTTNRMPMQARVFGAMGALLATVGVAAALHGYAAALQRDAALEVVKMEPVVITAARHATAAAMPHVGEI